MAAIDTIAQAQAEILSRAGEGFQDYADRALALFWESISLLIKSDGFDVSRIRAMYINLTSGNYDINSKTSPLVLPTEISTLGSYMLFKQTVLMRMGSRATATDSLVHCVEISQIEYDNYMIKKSLLPTAPKVLYYCNQYPNIGWVAANFTVSTSTVLIAEVRGYGIDSTVAYTTSTNLRSYMDYELQNEAMNMAKDMLLAELRT